MGSRRRRRGGGCNQITNEGGKEESGSQGRVARLRLERSIFRGDLDWEGEVDWWSGPPTPLQNVATKGI